LESSIPKKGKRVPREDTPGKTLGETPARTDWLNRFFTSYYAHRPVNATFIGLHDWDHRLPDLSEHGAGDTLADMQSLLSEAGEPGNGPVPGVGTVEGPSAGPVDPGGAESLEAIDRRLAEGFLRIQLWEYRSDHFHRGNPSLYSGEAIFGLMSLFLTDFAPFAERAEAAVERMAAVPALLAQGRDNVRRAPRAWTQRAIRECTGALAFLTGGVEHLLGECPAEVPGFRRNAERAAAAFRDYHLYLESELLPDPVDRWACGEEAFSLYMKEGHFLDQDPDEIVAYAESALAEAAGELTDPSFQARDARPGLSDLHPSVDRYYGRYREVWDSVRKRVEARSLLTWPDFPIRYIPRPEWAREAAPYLYFLFYRSPAAFNRPPVHDYLVTPIDRSMPPEKQQELLRATNDSVIKLNHVIHHGGVGHHVQNWHAFRSPSRIGRIAAVDCASRIAMFCGGTMAEGWACYATDLMREAGALTRLEEVAEIRGRTRMCARAIADVRLHQGRFTLEQATDYYVEHAGMERGPAHSEAVKNSMFPGAAVIYLLGTDSIHRLRREISVRLGQRFDLRSFHDDFLSYGSIPVSLIGAHMKGKAGHAG
jgi:hypothetical protein